MTKDTTEDLRRLIRRCCEESDAAGKVAREAKARQTAIRALRGRLEALEVQLGLRRAR